MKSMFKRMAWKFKNITRVDIALDGVKVLDLVDQCVKEKICRLGRAKLTPTYTAKNKMEGFNIGRSKSWSKMITGYVKSDLIEREGKFYIADFWKRTGLVHDGKVQG